ncbi:MAG: type II secretion system protein [Nanoarchaeota archaeon]|nr:type II secretion system protein [Nanoarchaeota archaeon]
MKSKRQKGYTLTELLVAAIVVLGISVLVALIIADSPSVSGRNEQEKPGVTAKAEKKIYSIEYFPNAEKPQIAVIVALEIIREEDRTNYSNTYGNVHCFLKAFEELSQKYEIGAIAQVQSELWNASITKGFIVHIKPLE